MAAMPLSARGALIAGGQVGATPRKYNPLLQKDEVGRARPSCYDLPEDTFAYGRPGNQDLEGAREVSMHWVSHTPSRSPEFHHPNFVRLHKKAAGARITNPKDLKHYRKEYDLTETPRLADIAAEADAARGPAKALVPSDVIPGFTYGRKVRPSTPIHEVISYRFGDKAERELRNFAEKFEQHREQQRTEVRRIPLTNASRGHASGAKKALLQNEDKKEPFKIKKFQNTTPKINSNLHTPRPRSYGGTKELISPMHDDPFMDEAAMVHTARRAATDLGATDRGLDALMLERLGGGSAPGSVAGSVVGSVVPGSVVAGSRRAESAVGGMAGLTGCPEDLLAERLMA